MIDFTVKLADIPIGVRANFETTKDFCKEYLTDEEPAFCVEVTKQAIARECVDVGKEAGNAGCAFSANYLETLALYRAIVEKLIDYNVVLFHGAAVEVDGQCFIFTARSGTGKTTHIRRWKRLLGDRMSVVNGDKPLLKAENGKTTVYGTPWCGKEKYGSNTSAPLKAICVLERSETNRIEKTAPADILGNLITQTFRPDDTASMIKTLAILDAITKNTEFYRLGCNMDISAAELSYNAMK